MAGTPAIVGGGGVTVTPTFPMQVSTVASITKSVSPLVINFIHVGNFGYSE